MNTIKKRTHYVNCYGVVFLQCIDKAVRVIHVGDPDAKIINHQAEHDVLPDVAPETRCMLAFVIPFDGKAFFEKLICKDSGLGKTIHPLLNVDVDPAVRSENVAKVVMVNDFVRGDVKIETHVLRVWYGGAEVEIGKVNAQKLGPRGSDGGIDE
jgi:hypothetical protein